MQLVSLVAFLLPSCMTARNLLRILKRKGWVEKSQSGSHLQLIHPVKKGKSYRANTSRRYPQRDIKFDFKTSRIKIALL